MTGDRGYGHSGDDRPPDQEGFASETGLGTTPSHQGFLNDPSEGRHDDH